MPLSPIGTRYFVQTHPTKIYTRHVDYNSKGFRALALFAHTVAVNLRQSLSHIDDAPYNRTTGRDIIGNVGGGKEASTCINVCYTKQF